MKIQSFKTILRIEEDFKTVSTKFINSGATPDEVNSYIDKFKTLSKNQRISGEEKNIDIWGKKSFDEFKSFVDSKESEITKSGKAKDPGKVLDITTPEQRSAGWRIIIPVNKEASCYEGRGTDWCVSKQNQEYYEDYFLDRNIILIFCLNDKKEKWAIALKIKKTDFDYSYSYEFFDSADNELNKDQFEEKTGLDIKEIADNAHDSEVGQERKEFSKVSVRNRIAAAKQRDPKLEKEILVSGNTKWVYDYAVNVIKGPWPEGENLISKDPERSYDYAKNVIKGRFPEGEDAIAKDGRIAFLYARDIIKGPFPKGEDMIAKSSNLAYFYAKTILKGRFPKGEEIISQYYDYSYDYAKYIIKGRFPKGEDVISQNSEYAYEYARDIIKGIFPKGEDAIAKDAQYSLLYATEILKGQFPKGEAAMSKNPLFNRLYKELLNK